MTLDVSVPCGAARPVDAQTAGQLRLPLSRLEAPVARPSIVQLQLPASSPSLRRLRRHPVTVNLPTYYLPTPLPTTPAWVSSTTDALPSRHPLSPSVPERFFQQVVAFARCHCPTFARLPSQVLTRRPCSTHLVQLRSIKNSIRCPAFEHPPPRKGAARLSSLSCL